MNVRPLHVLVVFLLFAAACGGSDDEGPSASAVVTTTGPASDEPADTVSTSSAGATVAATDESSDATTSTSAESSNDGPSGASLSIGDETWTFEQVDFCAMSIVEDDTVALLLISKQGDLQLSVRVIDPSGRHRLDGEGVWNKIDFMNVVDPTLNFWLASSETTGENFISVDGDTVGATTRFVDLRTNDVDGLPGTLQATCP